jgi:DNA-binding response OmpR family regulator
LCKELAELHDGKVWVESEIGTGSTFFVQLPYKETFAKVATALTKIPIFNEPKTVDFIEKDIVTNLSKPTVLVVEDNKDLRQYIELLLSDSYNIITAENGKEALERLPAKARQAGLTADGGRQTTNNTLMISRPRSTIYRPPSLIISDIMMPVMDGMALIKELKTTDDFRQIPVIMLTAQKNTDVKIEALRIGIDDYLTKPFQAEELLARVQNLIANTQQRIQIQPKNNATQSNTTITAFDLKWLKDIEEKILVNIGNTNFKLNDLAAEMNVSTRTMQMRIKAITGQTPKKYQRSIQLHHARKLLKSGDIKTISELSYQLGFEDQHYFSKLYKTEFGITPKEALQNIG